MDALLTIARSIRRAFSRAPEIPTRPDLRALDVAQDAEVEEMLSAVDALRLEAFHRQMHRYTRPELAQLGADLAASVDADIAGIRDAAALTVAQFTEWEAVRAARAARADTTETQSADATATAANLAARLLALVPQILHRLSMHVLRPVTPRAPAVACLA
ncbi:hypothetical protein [Microbacterium sp.]|uniref:hypothetical protein n=1 Tax=Microbacterium sp. TaxID=51671 RepID=UPI003C717BF7